VTTYRYPFHEPHPVTSPFGPRGLGFHGGTDFGWVPETGTSFPVLAAADGVINYCADESRFGGGRTVHINHGAEQSRYFHLREWYVSPGQAVAEGELIAMSGDTGVPGQPHLHFELLDENGNRYDPVTVLVWPDEPAPEPEEEPEMPSYTCTLLRNEYSQVFVQNGLTRRYIPDQDALNIVLGTGLCNPNIQDSAARIIDSIPWDTNDPYHPDHYPEPTPELAATKLDERGSHG
jgi:murein DD-endopeptidase MepM/ murein hydrolase activator NlpD